MTRRNRNHLSAGTVGQTCRPIRLLSAFAAGLFIVPASDAAADSNSLKRKVFKDCPAAITAVQSLAGQDRVDFVDYIRRVVNLEPTSPAEDDINPYLAAVLRKPMDHGAEPLYNSEVARTLDPREELEARQCGAQLMTYLLPEAINSLPDLIRIAADVNQPEELRKSLSDASRTMAEKWTTLSDQTLPAETARQLIALTDQIPPKLAADVILAFGGQTVGLLAQELEAAPPARRKNIFLILELQAGTDPEVTALVLSLFSSTDEDLRLQTVELIGRLTHFDRKLFSSVVPMVSDKSPAVRQAADRAIRSQIVLIHDPSEIDDPAVIDQLVAAFPRTTNETRGAITTLLQRTAGQLSPANCASLSGYLETNDSSLLLDTLAILNRTGPLPKPAYSRIVELLFEKDSQLEPKALDLLARQTERQDDFLSVLSRFLKLNGAEPSPERRLERTVWSADAVVQAGFGTKAKHLAPYFVDAIAQITSSADQTVEQQWITSLIKALVAIGPDSINDIKKLLGKNPESTVIALKIFDQMPVLPGSLLEELLRLYASAKDPARELLLNLFKVHAQDDLTVFKRMLRSSNPAAALAAAELLLRLKIPNDQIADSLKKNLPSMPCDQLQLLTAELQLVSKLDQTVVAKRREQCASQQEPAPPEKK